MAQQQPPSPILTAPLVTAFLAGLGLENGWRYASVLNAFREDHPTLPTSAAALADWVGGLAPAFQAEPLSHATRRDYHQRLRTFYDWCRGNAPGGASLPPIAPETFGHRARRHPLR